MLVTVERAVRYLTGEGEYADRQKHPYPMSYFSIEGARILWFRFSGVVVFQVSRRSEVDSRPHHVFLFVAGGHQASLRFGR